MAELASLLAEKGYRQIALTRSGVGHFHAEGFLNETPVSILIDTGANETICDVEIAQKMGLPLTKMPGQAGGAGSVTLDIYEVSEARLIVAGVTPKLEALYAMDFSHVNEALRAKDSQPVDVILGAGVLDAHSAVIDYGSNSLFLA